jgi:hypothetical protein
MPEMPNSATAGRITFYSFWLPALAPGEYSVSVKPSVKVEVKTRDSDKLEEKALPTTPVTENFHVGGPRYALTGSEAYSCYPAPGQIGQFFDTLPHIVFDRCTLPWERTIDGSNPTVKPVEHEPYPWLALILLTDADFSAANTASNGLVPPIFATTLAEVLSPKNDALGKATSNIIGPSFKRDPYDSDMDPCQTIDLPAPVFKAVMPRKEDLPFLAHVRQVETTEKETWSLLKEGKFSVVVCNRFPESQATSGEEKDWGIVNTVCLVSLEGWGHYLDKPDSLDGGKSARLLVLGSWRFTCQGESDFNSQMVDLNDERLLRRPPLDGKPAPPVGEDQALKDINHALEMGFAPVNHDLRNGDTTISWYRGPLVPMLYGVSMSYADISCADAAQRYSPETGMFDASYAAAWELGRLLALQDQAFAQALFRFRTDYQRWVRSTNTEAIRKLANLQGQLGTLNELKPRLGQPDNIRDRYARLLTAAKYLTNGDANANASEPACHRPKFPATVQNWLGQAMLLYGVPFQYLVPDENMLSAKSIRFFYLNPEWINCLLQGACSVGRTSQTDELADQLLRARFFEVSEKMAENLRLNAKLAADRRRNGTEEKETAVEEEDEPTTPPKPVLNWPLSGYLLRSPAVESWIGLEATAEGVDSGGNALKPLQILRMDRLAPDILLCIYNGKVTKIEVKQPPEAIHFGAASKADVKNAHVLTSLRIIKGSSDTMGDPIGAPVDVPTDRKRVVKVAELAEKISNKLIENGQWAKKDWFTSAEFAVEMIQSPAKVTFTVRA